MKMSKELYEKTKNQFKKHNLFKYKENYENAGLTMERYRWDCFWLLIDAKDLNQQEYRDLHDDHIDTALRKITNTI